MIGALDGTRVLELARFQAGPRCGMLLSDLGAEVIKIERLGGEETRQLAPLVDGHSIYFSVYNRGKKSVCIDLRKDAGKEVFRELVKTADLVLENFRPGTMANMGFGYDELCKLKPDIILISVSGFGQSGPYRDRPGFDWLGQAMSGLMTLTGQGEDKPIGTASSIVDRCTALHATIGALAALRHRDRTGEGQVVDVCLLDAGLSLVEIPAIYYLETGQEGGETGRPPYRAKDGWVVISAPFKMSTRLLRAIGVTAEPSGPIGLGLQNTPLRDAVAGWCAEHTVEEICKTMQDAEVAVAPVLSIPQVTEDPHMWERKMVTRVTDEHGREAYVPGLTIKFSKTPGGLGPVPEPGQHTDEILRLLGYSGDRIEELRQSSVI